MEWVGYDYAYMFRYSERPDTIAATHYRDNVPDEIKDRRLNEIISLQQQLSYKSNNRDIGSIFDVMIEGFSKRSSEHFSGRNSQNKVVVFPKTDNKPGDCIRIKILHVTSATLIGNAV
jgi:tRNA-2-methylthio-N6-dimethylallyladenosine synthase